MADSTRKFFIHLDQWVIVETEGESLNIKGSEDKNRGALAKLAVISFVEWRKMGFVFPRENRGLH